MANVTNIEKQVNTEMSVKECRSFELGWDAIPNGEIVRAREEIKRLWGVNSDTTFISRKKGESPMSPADMMAVEIVHQKYGINAWTGERI